MTKELLSIEQFEDLARQNPDEAENYIIENESSLIENNLIDIFESTHYYYHNAWHWEAFEQSQAQAFHERMDYR